MTGAEIKTMVKSQGVNLWQVADRLGIRDNEFSRRLRKEFTDAEATRIASIVDEIIKERA